MPTTMNTCVVTKHGRTLEIVEGEPQLPEGQRLRAVLLPEEEYTRWESIPPESRFWMLIQSTSPSFREWLEEESWDDLFAATLDDGNHTSHT
jgi:hypothetical protein